MTEAVFQMVFGLLFVICLIYAASFAYRKRQKGTNLINLVSYHSLGQKMGVAALRVGDEILILGVTPTDMKLIRKMPDMPAAGREVTDIADRLHKFRRSRKGL